MARATRSLPVPVSPSISAVASCAAIRRTRCRMARQPGDSPTRFSCANSSCPPSRSGFMSPPVSPSRRTVTFFTHTVNANRSNSANLEQQQREQRLSIFAAQATAQSVLGRRAPAIFLFCVWLGSVAFLAALGRFVVGRGALQDRAVLPHLQVGPLPVGDNLALVDQLAVPVHAAQLFD